MSKQISDTLNNLIYIHPVMIPASTSLLPRTYIVYTRRIASSHPSNDSHESATLLNTKRENRELRAAYLQNRGVYAYRIDWSKF